jgi:hypothetical protein
MNVDVLFTSENSGTLYAGIERDGKFAGKPVRDGRLHGPLKSSMKGTLVARFVTRIELADHDKALPMHADVMVEGAVSAVRLDQYLRGLRERREQVAATKAAEPTDKAKDAAE